MGGDVCVYFVSEILRKELITHGAYRLCVGGVEG